MISFDYILLCDSYLSRRDRKGQRVTSTSGRCVPGPHWLCVPWAKRDSITHSARRPLPATASGTATASATGGRWWDDRLDLFRPVPSQMLPRCPSCLALQTPDSVWCRLCGHRLAEVPDGISDGVRRGGQHVGWDPGDVGEEFCWVIRFVLCVLF